MAADTNYIDDLCDQKDSYIEMKNNLDFIIGDDPDCSYPLALQSQYRNFFITCIFYISKVYTISHEYFYTVLRSTF